MKSRALVASCARNLYLGLIMCVMAPVAADVLPGTVRGTDHHLATISMTKDRLPRVGDRVEVYESFGESLVYLATLTVIRAYPGTVIARVESANGVIRRGQKARVFSYNPQSLADFHKRLDNKRLRDLEHGVTPASEKALFRAVRRGQDDWVAALIQSGANVNSRDKKGATPLMHAAKRGHTRVVERLIMAGAEVNTRTGIGITALVLAADRGRHKVLQLLLEAGADIMFGNDGGETVLAAAAYSGSVEAVQLLILGGADVNGSSVFLYGRLQNETPLMIAVRRKSVEVIKLLLEAGADPEFRNDTGQNAIDIATTHGNKKALGLLMANEQKK